MNLHDPSSYIRQQSVLLDIPIRMLCRKAKISQRAIHRWSTKPSRSLIMMAKIEDVFNKLRGYHEAKFVEEITDRIQHIEDPDERTRCMEEIKAIMNKYDTKK